MSFRSTVRLSLLLAFTTTSPAVGAFDLTVSVSSSASFTPVQTAHLSESLSLAEARWEAVITGYQDGISLTGVNISVTSGSSFADTLFPSTVVQGGYALATSTTIRVNPAVVDSYFSWDGVGPANPNPAYLGLSYLDDILEHEIGHALGIGTLWKQNNLSVAGTGKYTGRYGTKAYQIEFQQPNSAFVPVEQAGSSGTIDNHWNQLMRSSSQEGNPSDPWSLSPLTGITDLQGRDLALELMTGALDPDYGEPFLSNTSIQSLRDLGFAVVPEPGGLTPALCSLVLSALARKRSPHIRASCL